MAQFLEIIVKTHLPAPLARTAKRIAVYPRYIVQSRACRNGFRQFGAQYPQQVLFIAGLPKSGTTWLERMIASYPGFHSLLIPEANFYELASGGSHDYNLPPHIFSRFNGKLVLTKMHVFGSKHNVEVLHKAGIRYVILYRDLRDVAVSYVFYVRQTPWHPEYPIYNKLSIEQGLFEFGKRLLSAYIDWVRLWHTNHDPNMSIEIQYEQMLANTEIVLTRVAQHFELDSSSETIRKIVDQHRFQRLSGGKRQGEENKHNFFRKGISGDWKNHFTQELKDLYKQKAGDFLIEFGYESDHMW